MWKSVDGKPSILFLWLILSIFGQFNNNWISSMHTYIYFKNPYYALLKREIAPILHPNHFKSTQYWYGFFLRNMQNMNRTNDFPRKLECSVFFWTFLCVMFQAIAVINWIEVQIKFSSLVRFFILFALLPSENRREAKELNLYVYNEIIQRSRMQTILFHQNSLEKFRHCKVFSTIIFHFFVCIFVVVAVFDLSHKCICIWKTFWNQKNSGAAARIHSIFTISIKKCISDCDELSEIAIIKTEFHRLKWQWLEKLFLLLSHDLKFSELQ